MIRVCMAVLVLVLPLQLCWAQTLDDAVKSSERTPAFALRDSYRHPLETLEFFKLSPDKTVVEIWPGAGWYTEILAPYLKEGGVFYAAHFALDSEIPYFAKSRQAFDEKLEAVPELYGNVKVVEFNPAAGVLSVPEGSADLVLTFRNVHNWLRSDSEQQAFELFYNALKPGGMLGVVEHRSKAGQSRQWMLENGYMTEESVIALAEGAGFSLVEKSEINANPKDSADHPKGVWTLPPVLRLGDEKREYYESIGESDRMTLLFVKPAN